MKTITIWERLNEKSRKWEHNHISEGFDPDLSKPTPISDVQQKSWSGATWRKKKGTIDKHRVVTED